MQFFSMERETDQNKTTILEGFKWDGWRFLVGLHRKNLDSNQGLFLKVWAYLVGNGVSDGPYKSKNIIAIHSYSSCSREFRNGNGAPDTAETETNIIIIIYIYNTWWWWWRRRWWRWWYIINIYIYSIDILSWIVMNIASPLGQRPHEFRWVFKLHPMRLSTQDFWRPHMWIHFRGPSGTKWLDHAIRSRDFGSVRSCWSFCSKEMSYSMSFVSIFHFSEDLIFFLSTCSTQYRAHLHGVD